MKAEQIIHVKEKLDNDCIIEIRGLSLF
jgi:hypothetical protein